ncbi:hypothetical protein [Brooklawnia sp.]|uniref:hypothetical protein n=1 Tax=Brooklawnia sp. TaxID=2699740 RepID=UPI00311EC524
MTARRAILDPGTEFDDTIAAAFAESSARRGVTEGPSIVDDAPVSVAAARRAISAPINFEPDDALVGTRQLPKITATVSANTAVKGQRLRRGLFGAAAVATASAILIVPSAVSTVTAQPLPTSETPISRSLDRNEIAVNPVELANTKASAEAEAARQAEEARLAEEARQAEEAARIAEEERVAAEQAAAEQSAAQATQQTGSGSSAQTSSSSSTVATGGSCSFDGSGLGLTATAYSTFQAVCAQFPGVTSYGGWRNAADDHGSGQAIDIMISGDAGWQIANWLVANSSSLNVEYVIYQQSMWGSWSPSAGFTMMEDRGSVTANHYDHVHVTVR